MAALTLAAIRQTGLAAYSPAQVAAWSAGAKAERLCNAADRGAIIRVAADDADRPVAYCLLERDGHLDMLYCHPDHGGRGLGGRLLVEAEAIARDIGLARLFTEASEIARPVFARAGYTLLHRRDFTIGPAEARVAIHNYAMEKVIAQPRRR